MNIDSSSTRIIIDDLKHSKKIRVGNKIRILFDQPYHLYLDEEQAKAYLEMINAESFATLLHDPALSLIERYREKILKDFKGPLSFYDLGPGLPIKTIPILEQLKKNRILFKYYAVDISKSFLEITKTEIAKIGINAEEINERFERLPDRIQNDQSKEKLFFIGLTFNNYRPNTILSLLKKLAGDTGTCLIITEYFKKKNIETILVPYKDKYAENFNYLSLKLAGIEKKDLKYFTVFRNKRIEMGFRVCNKIIIENDLVLEKDSEIVTAVSYRYSKNILIKYISRYFSSYEVYEHNEKDISLVAFKFSN
jgi:uncharacterized SAM-dependent methyltransferase